MKKAVFFTQIRINGEVVAFQVTGYHDGLFNYYKNRFGMWHAVHPLIGLSAAAAYTRRECQTMVFNNMERVEEYMHTHGERETEKFNQLRKVVDPSFKV